MIEDRERLRLEVETFLREKGGYGEDWVAVPENWDARKVAMMVFRREFLEVWARAPLSDFEAWRSEVIR